MSDRRLIVERTPASALAAQWLGVAGPLQRLIDTAGQFGGAGMHDLAAVAYGTRDWLLARVVVHESAHHVIAEQLGVASEMVIERGARFGNGYCKLSASVLKKPDLTRRMVGLAGSTAAQIAEYGAHATASWVGEHFKWTGALSPSDAELATGFNGSEVAQCHRLVLASWPAITAQARRVLAIELVAHGQKGLQ